MGSGVGSVVVVSSGATVAVLVAMGRVVASKTSVDSVASGTAVEVGSSRSTVGRMVGAVGAEVDVGSGAFVAVTAVF
jgi:uncharacterized protein YabE (DUF348 family)